MITTKTSFFNIFISGAIFLAILISPNSAQLSALVCDPLPTDPNELLECNAQDIGNYPGSGPKAPGTDPSNPTVFPFDGVSGIAAAYSPKSDLVLIVAGRFVSDGDRRMMGIMADPKTLAPKGQAFRIDRSTGTGTPRVAYGEGLEKFLVVWEDIRPCGQNCRSEYGRFVSAEGSALGVDFPIHQGAAFLANVTYDSVNKKFVVLYEKAGSILELRTIDGDGKVSGPILVQQSFPYQGQPGVAYNSNTNEYWVVYAVIIAGSDTSQEDGRIMWSRVSAETLKPIGEPVQLSQTRLGRNAVQSARIAYSPKGGAVAVWLERGRNNTTAGTWGRTIYDNGSLSGEYAVITAETDPVSEGFASDVIEYNKWTDSFFVSSGDWSGNAWITELGLEGGVFNSLPAISVSETANANWLQKFFAIKTAFAAVGSFNVTSAATRYGAVTLASRNYTAVVGTSQSSIGAPLPPAAPAPSFPPGEPTDLNKLPTLVNRIYIWALGLSVLLALLMMVLGGYYLMTAAGNAEQASKGKEFITSAIIGVTILFLSYLLLNEINPDLVNFNIDSINELNEK